MCPIKEILERYERFLEELCRFDSDGVKIPAGPVRPQALTLITNYPKPPTKEEIYSKTVYFEDLPFNHNLDLILSKLKEFGPYSIKFNEKRNAFVTFSEARSVHDLVEISQINEEDRLQFRIKSDNTFITIKFRAWRLRDNQCTFKTNTRIEERRSVYISNLPCHYTAVDLGSHMTAEFGGVSYASLNTDENHYPKGTAVVAFYDYQSQMKALAATRLKIPDLRNPVVITPFFRKDQNCDFCYVDNFGLGSNYATIFCTNSQCLKYFCVLCWSLVPEHVEEDQYNQHISFMRPSD